MHVSNTQPQSPLLSGLVHFPKLTPEEQAAAAELVAAERRRQALLGPHWPRLALVHRRWFTDTGRPDNVIDADGRWRHLAGPLWWLACRYCGNVASE